MSTEIMGFTYYANKIARLIKMSKLLDQIYDQVLNFDSVT